MDDVSDVDNLLSDLLNNLSKDDNLLGDDWLLILWSGLPLLLKNNDLSLNDSDLLNVLVDVLLQNNNNVVGDLRWSLWSVRSAWSEWSVWSAWSEWSTWSGWLEDDSLDVLLNSDNLLVDLSDNLGETEDLLANNWLFSSWSSVVLLLQDSDLVMNNGNLLEKLGDLLLVNLDDVSFFLSQMSWLWSWSWSWVNNSDNNSLDVVDLLGDVLDNLSEENNLLLDDWLLVNWGSLVLSSQSLDNLGDLSDLLLVDVDLLGENLDNLLSDWGRWSWGNSFWGGWFLIIFISWLDMLWLGHPEGDLSAALRLLSDLETLWLPFSDTSVVMSVGVITFTSLILSTDLGDHSRVLSASLLDGVDDDSD